MLFSGRNFESLSKTLESDVNYLRYLENWKLKSELEKKFPRTMKNLRHKILNEAISYVLEIISLFRVSEENHDKVSDFCIKVLKENTLQMKGALINIKDFDLFEQYLSHVFGRILDYICEIEQGEKHDD
jgi:hypothetical protein